jgi:hypothetical protein
MSKKVSGSACGNPNLAPIKPVDQSRTKTKGNVLEKRFTKVLCLRLTHSHQPPQPTDFSAMRNGPVWGSLWVSKPNCHQLLEVVLEFCSMFQQLQITIEISV